jgi:hypothetical protein
MFAVFAFFCFALAFFYYLHNRGRRRERIFNLILLRRELSHYQFAATNPDDAKRLSGLIAGVDSLLQQFGASTGPYEGNRRREAAWRLVCRHLGYSTISHPPWAARNGDDESTAGGLPPEVAATAEPASQPAAEESTVLVVTPEPAELTATDPARVSPSPSEAETGADDSPESEDEFELPSLSELNRRLARVEAVEEEPEADQTPAEAGADDSATGAEAPEAATASAASSRQRDEEKPGAPDSTPAKDDAAEAAEYAWRPVAPNRTQRFIQIVTGASGLFVGFLTQNIGWFIGGFSFLAGAVFLTAISGGILRILLVTGFLSIYAVFFLWGGWQIRRHRPAVSGASTILAVLSVLLMPLCIAASVRVYADSGSDLPVTGGGVLITLLLIAFCAYGSRLAVGIADRSLSAGISRRFWILAAVQGTAPFVAYVPHPGGLIGLHLLLLTLLAEGVIRFLRSWMTAVFRNRPTSAYLAAGLLVYAALVSFLHVTLRYPRPLPAGYFGPFLMLLSGLLVYVDQEIQQRFQRYVILSRFGILAFGVSTAALLLSQPGPPARIITYFAGVWIFGAAVWSYLSLPSMLFFLICACGLYGQFVLAPLPSSLYFLASIPGLSVLFAVHLWAGGKKAHRLSRLTFRILFMLAAGLAAWSLVHAEPGVTGLASACVLTLTIYGILRYAAGYVFESLGFFRASDSADLTDGYLCYAVSLAALTVIAYFPDIPGVHRWTLSALGLTLFALAFALWGCFSGRGAYGRKEVVTNSALLYALASMAAVVASDPRLFTDYRLFTEPQVLISTGGAAATWLLVGYHLRIRFVVSVGLGGNFDLLCGICFSAPSSVEGAVQRPGRRRSKRKRGAGGAPAVPLPVRVSGFFPVPVSCPVLSAFGGGRSSAGGGGVSIGRLCIVCRRGPAVARRVGFHRCGMHSVGGAFPVSAVHRHRGIRRRLHHRRRRLCIHGPRSNRPVVRGDVVCDGGVGRCPRGAEIPGPKSPAAFAAACRILFRSGGGRRPPGRICGDDGGACVRFRGLGIAPGPPGDAGFSGVRPVLSAHRYRPPRTRLRGGGAFFPDGPLFRAICFNGGVR